MKNVCTLIACLVMIQGLVAQGFEQICPGTNPDDFVVDFAYYQDTLYATGFFQQICDSSIRHIAKWQDNEWQKASFNLPNPGHSLQEINGKLYITGYEFNADSNWVYVFDGNSLEKLGSAVSTAGSSLFPNIYDIIEYQGNLVACGEFNRVGSDTVAGIMQWDGTAWGPLGDGLSGSLVSNVTFPHKLLVHNDELYVVGNFRSAGGMLVDGVAKWDGTTWANMGAGFNSTVYSIAVFEGSIIVGGTFTRSGTTWINRIARWDSTGWAPLNFGVTNPVWSLDIFVHTLKEIGGALYIAGSFEEITYADTSTAMCNNVVAYRADTLDLLGGGVPNNTMEALALVGEDTLLVGGGNFGMGGYTGMRKVIVSPPGPPLSVNSFEPKLRIFPNPFDRFLRIESDQPITHYEIRNQTGQLVKEGRHTNNKIEVDLAAGIYYLRVFNQAGLSSVHKVVKQ
ncbi:MAG: T9SS type A sorting domain-containing protein [Bacteroidota bacterium]